MLIVLHPNKVERVGSRQFEHNVTQLAALRAALAHGENGAASTAVVIVE